MPARTLLGALVLDAFDEFERAIDALPAPGRHRRLGRLNAPAWAIGHLAAGCDAWLNVFCRQLSADDWCADLTGRQRAAEPGTAVPVDLDEACTAFRRLAERSRPYLESAGPVELAQPADPGPRWPVVPAAYLVARTAAHVFVHAGELTVVASLVGAGDLGLPGALTRTRAAADAGAIVEAIAPLVALARDARGELERVARVVPRPAYGALFAPRLSAGSLVVAHAALTQDLFWNERVQGRERDAWLRALRLEDVPPGEPAPACDFDDALDAYRRVCARSEEHIAAIGSGDGAVDATDAIGAAWTAAHLFAHSGELAAIASLAGAPDLGLPGQLAHVGAAVPAAGA